MLSKTVLARPYLLVGLLQWLLELFRAVFYQTE